MVFQNNAVVALVTGDDESQSEDANFFLAGGAAPEPGGIVERAN
jgi:hypothetical protein